MSFIRPEAISSLRKYRGFILAGLIVMAGLFIVFTSYGTTRIAGCIFLVVGGLVGHDAYRRF